MPDEPQSLDDFPGDDVPTTQFTMTMADEQLRRVRELVPEGTTDQERIRMLVSQALFQRQQAVTPDSIEDSVVAALREAFKTDAEGRLVVVNDHRDDE